MSREQDSPESVPGEAERRRRFDELRAAQRLAYEAVGLHEDVDEPWWVDLRAHALDPDATTRAEVFTRYLGSLQAVVDVLSQLRDDALIEMRATGASYDQVARALNISKSRAQQLCRRLADQAEN